MAGRLRLSKSLSCVLFSCLEWRNTSLFFKALLGNEPLELECVSQTKRVEQGC
jgi:hypothetical protein